MSRLRHNDIHIAGGGRALVTFNTPSKSDTAVTRVLIDTDEYSGEIATWGVNNDYPQKHLEKVRKNESSVSALRVLRNAHYGSGFVLTEETHDEDGKRLVLPKSIKAFPTINSFWRKNQMKKFWRASIKDLEDWSIAFPEYILSNDYKTINRVYRQKTAHCRFELMNEKTGYIEHVYISTKWGESLDLKSKYVARVPLIDGYWSAEEVKEYCKKKKIKKFIRPIFYPLSDESYYPKSDGHAAERSGWLDIANSIPAFKRAFMKNQINIKFLIEVNEEYFSRKYGDDWEIYEPDEQKRIQQEFVEELDATLRDSENSGKSILSTAYMGQDGKPIPGLTIETVDNKIQDGAYLDDTSAGVQQILTAYGVDPSLIGAGIPGGKLGAGSGSDKRQAWLILSALLKPNRETTLEVFEFIQEYNGWPDELSGAFEDTVLTTLDQNPTGTEKAAQV